MINALHVGLLSRECNRVCIIALTACALEMKKSMYHLIPQVLLNFSKISATKQIATPMLEFLSTLIRLPGEREKKMLLLPCPGIETALLRPQRRVIQ